jgi:hypothetical protein
MQPERIWVRRFSGLPPQDGLCGSDSFRIVPLDEIKRNCIIDIRGSQCDEIAPFVTVLGIFVDFSRYYMTPLMEKGLVERTDPENPMSPRQEYKLA